MNLMAHIGQYLMWRQEDLDGNLPFWHIILEAKVLNDF